MENTIGLMINVVLLGCLTLLMSPVVSLLFRDRSQGMVMIAYTGIIIALSPVLILLVPIGGLLFLSGLPLLSILESEN